MCDCIFLHHFQKTCPQIEIDAISQGQIKTYLENLNRLYTIGSSDFFRLFFYWKGSNCIFHHHFQKTCPQIEIDAISQGQIKTYLENLNRLYIIASSDFFRLFFYWKGSNCIFLHHFQKTCPQIEIDAISQGQIKTYLKNLNRLYIIGSSDFFRLFFYWKGSNCIFLHHFLKTCPQIEIDAISQGQIKTYLKNLNRLYIIGSSDFFRLFFYWKCSNCIFLHHFQKTCPQIEIDAISRGQIKTYLENLNRLYIIGSSDFFRLFFYWKGSNCIFLHHFQKTCPQIEIDAISQGQIKTYLKNLNRLYIIGSSDFFRLFFYWKGSNCIFLHHFLKTCPQIEIDAISQGQIKTYLKNLNRLYIIGSSDFLGCFSIEKVLIAYFSTISKRPVHKLKLMPSLRDKSKPTWKT